MLSLAHAGPAIASAFLASLVEAVEALTIVLAVGTVRGWRPALAGTLAGLAFLALLVLAFGPLIARMPIEYMQLAVGVLLLLFGMRWLRKAILRSGGVIALRDEAGAYAEHSAALAAAHPLSGWDAIAIVTAFKAVVLEGLEVVFIVLAVGAAGGLRGSRRTRSSSRWACCSPRSACSGRARAWGFTGPGTISRSSASRRSFSPPRPP